MLIRLRGIKRVKAKGRWYYYHRATGKRIGSEYGTPDFIEEIKRLDGLAPVKAKTLGALILAYKSSPKFARLADRTRAEYIEMLERVRPIESFPVAWITAEKLTELKDSLKCGERARAYVIQVLSAVFRWGIPRGWTETNPARAVEIEKRKSNANRPWEAHELKAVLEEAYPNMRIAILLGGLAGIREGDVLRLPWSAYDGTEIKYTQRKTGREVRVRVHSLLKGELDRASKKKVGPLIVTSQRKNRPFTEDGFRGSLFKLIRKLHKLGRIGKGLTFHGLRHTMGTALAESGASTRAIAGVLGHADEKMAQHYSRRANTARESDAAIQSLEQNEHGTWKTFGKPRAVRKKSGAK